MRIGVTGVFASGKGTVCSMFEKLGAENIDTDIIAREIVKQGSPVLKKITDEFGLSILSSDGSLNRPKLAEIVFSDKTKLAKLNNITHPEILRITLERSNSNKIYVINVPLLFESGFDKVMDKTILVTASYNQVIKRGIIRDSLTKEDIEKRLQHQISLNEKMKLADYVIDNSNSPENTERQVINLWNILTNQKEWNQ